jgi:hypothetical protein
VSYSVLEWVKWIILRKMIQSELKQVKVSQSKLKWEKVSKIDL